MKKDYFTTLEIEVIRERKTKGKKGKTAQYKRLLSEKELQLFSNSEVVPKEEVNSTEFQDSDEFFFEYSIGKRTIRRRKTLEQAITDSARLIELYAGLVKPLIWSIQDLSKDMERIIRRFDKSNMIMEAKCKASDTVLDNVYLSVARDSLMAAGSLSDFVCNLQLAQTADRFNITSVKKFGQDLPTDLYDKVSDIAINGVAVPRTESFISQLISET